MVEALTEVLTTAFNGLRRDFAYPIPQFSGKKGEKPESHCLKVEDWFEHFEIEDGANVGQRVQKFKETLLGKPRQWFNSLDPLPDTYAGANGLKARFTTRWSLKGKTHDALYAEWQHLAFDPAQDDIEDFINDVQEIAAHLEYPERAQIMAIKGCLPMDVHNSCLNMDTMAVLKPFLIRVFDNPRVKKAYVKTEGAAAGATAFSTATDINSANSSEVGKLVKKLDSLELAFHSFQNRKPYKPQITPKRVRFQRNLPQHRQRDNFIRSRPPQNNSRFSPRPQRFIRGKGRGRFHSSPNVRRPRIAGRTPDKDKMRCHYCQEHGHFIKECRKRKQDERKSINYRLLTVAEDEEEDIDYQMYSDSEDVFETELNI